jgi:cardiolipin synthase A/B
MTENIKKYIPGNQVNYLLGGEAYFDLLIELIGRAKHEIHFQLYIFAPDETGKLVSDALIKAAKRGVRVYLVLDAYGSLEMMKNETWCKTWQDAGLTVKWFGKMFTSENINFGRRMHHKIFIADGIETLVTGLNVANRYSGKDGQTPWLDFAVHVKGPIGLHLREYALFFIKRKEKQGIGPAPAWIDYKPVGDIPVKLIRNDWLRGVYDIFTSYRNAFLSAKKEIIIAGAYFMPGRRMRKSLQNAAKRGVGIKIILSHDSDNWIAKYAQRYLYGWILKNKINIYEWTDSVMHGKVAVIDAKWCTVGSYNLNYLSAYESIELNYAIKTEPGKCQLKEILLGIIESGCERVTYNSYKKHRTFIEFIKEWTAYRIARSIIRIFQLTGWRRVNKRN